MTLRDEPRHNLRLTPELKAKLAHAAIDSGRSMNAEILSRLERSFAPDPLSLLGEALSHIKTLNDDDRKRLGQLLGELGSILAK